ncbi:MAG: PAS domain S-box protein, partial [Thalassolituus sp.]
MLPQNGVSQPAQRVRTSLPLFVFSFLFLSVVLGFHTWQQWQTQKYIYRTDVERTLEHYTKQSTLILRAGLHANQIFTRSYGNLLEAYARTPETIDEARLWEHVNAAIFNGTGFFIADGSANILNHYGPLLSDRELGDITTQLRSQGMDSAIFSLRYSHQGGYYVGTRFNADSGPMIFVTRRAYSNLSDIIYRGGFNGYEMMVIDRRSSAIVIREQYYADSTNPIHITPEEERSILYQISIPQSPWDVVAIPVSDFWQQQAYSNIRAPLIFLLVFVGIQIILWRYLTIHERQVRALRIANSKTEQRADKVLKSFDEAFISPDAWGDINYLNPRALTLRGRTAAEPLMGRRLSEVWPAPQALWNRGLEVDELEQLKGEQRILKHEINGSECILEQNMQPLYENNRVTGYVWLLRDITESEQASAALAQSRSRYKALFEEAGIAHCLLDLSSFDGSIDSLHLLSVNDSTLHLANFQDTEAMALHYRNHPEGLQPLLDSLSTARQLRLMNTECEITLLDRHGEPREVWVSISFRSGTNSQVLMTMLDITERKRATEKIREREAFWTHVMEAMPDVIYVMEINERLDLHTVFTNRHISQMLGYPETDEFRGRTWLDYVIHDDIQRCQDGMLLIRNATSAKTLEGTARFVHFNGDIRVLKFRNTPFVFDETGKVTRYIGTARDVTEDIEKQEQIVDSERRYRLLAENMSDIVWATDAELNFNFVSTSVQRVLGYKQEELFRAGISKIIDRADLKRIYRALQTQVQNALSNPDAAKRRNAVLREDVSATSANGTPVLLELRASLLWNDNGELQGMLGICRDVTEARDIEQELQLAAEVFESSNEAILITDHRLRIANTNRAFHHITGYETEDVAGKTPDFLISAEHVEEDLIEKIGESLMVDGYWQGEISYRRKHGDLRTGWAGVSAIRDQNQEVQSLISLCRT